MDTTIVWQDVIDETVVKLCNQYPGKFDILSSLAFEQVDDVWMHMGYDYANKTVMYNTLNLTVDVLPGCLAFISLMVSGPCSNIPAVGLKFDDLRTYNVAAQLYVIDQLRGIGDFTFPEACYGLDHKLLGQGLSVDEIYSALLVDIETDDVYSNCDFEQVEQQEND